MDINKDYPCKSSNYRKGRRDSIKYIVIHYVGATGGALDNVKYYASSDVGTSAHYFVGHANEGGAIYQSVAPENCAWHCGSETGVYYSDCRNDSSIGIEMCCHKASDGKWYFDDITVQKAIELTRWLMKEYNISEKNVIRHYDVTRKRCPAPFVADEAMWQSFQNKIKNVDEYSDVTDIVRELGRRGIVSDTFGMEAEMNQDTDGRLYWLARKLVSYIANRSDVIKNDVSEYEDVHDIVWDLNYRGIVTDMSGMEKEMNQNVDGRLYWLARKGLQYIRLRD